MPAPDAHADGPGLWRAFVMAVRFLTRLPVPAVAAGDADVGRALAFFPVVGFIVGVVLAAAAWVLAAWLTAPLVGVVVVALLAALTGGLHLDGVADVFDALGGAYGDRERALAIMRDSRIGAHGAVAVMLVLLAKVLAVAHIVQRHELRWLVVSPAIARWAVLPLMVYFPYARESGLGKTFAERGSRRELAWATACIVAVLVWTRGRGVGAAAGALAVALLCAQWMQRRLGGMTGDVYGMAIELAEVTCLVVAGAGS